MKKETKHFLEFNENENMTDWKRWQDIIKNMAEINKIEMRKTMQIMSKSWFFEKVNKIDKP